MKLITPTPQLNEVINKLLDQDNKLKWLKENIVTRKEFLDNQDKVITILERLDKERIFTNNNVERHEDKIEIHDVKIKKHESDIKNIKGVLKLTYS